MKKRTADRFIEGYVTAVYYEEKKGGMSVSAYIANDPKSKGTAYRGFTTPSMPEVTKGDFVKLGLQRNGQYENIVSIEIQKDTKPTTAAAPVKGNDTPVRVPYDDNGREYKIVFQTGQKVAGSLVSAMIRADKLTAKSKADYADLVVQTVISIARQLADTTMQIKYASPVAAAKATPEAAEEEPEVTYED